MTSRVSFTIRRPPSASASTPSQSRSNSRPTSTVPHQVEVDSSDEEVDENATELVTGFDQSGAQRLFEKPKPAGPLVIAPLANRDWRAVARARKQHFIPDGAAAPVGKDGSQGGLGTRDSINSGPQATGLVKRERVVVQEEATKLDPHEEELVAPRNLEESEDERARRALLASAGGEGDVDALTIDAIPVGDNEFTLAPKDETDAYKQDVVTRPESATLADYERVPVSQFGAALLRGMGWKEGTAASRTRRGLVEPWVPPSRPALLGIGAKERPAEDIPQTEKGRYASKRPEKRYMPLVKMEREGSARPPPPSRSRSRSPSRSRTTSRVGSKSSSPYPNDKDGSYRHQSRDKEYDGRKYERLGGNKDRDSLDRVLHMDHRSERSHGRHGSRDKERGRDRVREERSGRGKEYRREESEGFARERSTRY